MRWFAEFAVITGAVGLTVEAIVCTMFPGMFIANGRQYQGAHRVR